MKMFLIIPVAVAVLFLQGCATVIKGYYSDVELTQAPDSLQVFTADGVELPVKKVPLRF